MNVPIATPVRKALTSAGVTLLLVASMGASCAPRMGKPFSFSGPQAPVVLSGAPTAADVVRVVNDNTARITTYQAPQASVALSGASAIPILSGSIAAERPNRFRMRAVTALTGPEVDLGSNEERFWVWARRNEPPGLYTARHSEFATSEARRQLPFDPLWLVDALGMATLDPGATYQGPFPRADGSLELRSQGATPSGSMQRVIVVEKGTGVLREQHLYDGAGSLLASVVADRLRYDPVAQASYPEKVTVQIPAAQMGLVVTTGPVVLNAPIADGGQLWQMPQIAGVPVVDLGAGAPPLAATRAWDLTGAAARATPLPPPIATPFASTAAEPLSGALPTAAATGDPLGRMGRLPNGGVPMNTPR
ncbi:MAG: hypothetical protein ACRCT8_12325 [Lacipirellulaceae bacterium]